MSYSNKTHVILLKDENGEWVVSNKDVCLVKEDEISIVAVSRGLPDYEKEASGPVLAIKINGESYHIEGAFHWQNDRKKDSIMGTIKKLVTHLSYPQYR